jgi:hypothetical protein
MGLRMQRASLPDARTKIWSAIRFMKRFTFEELEQTTEQSYPHVRRYVRRLLDAGYLRLVSQAKGRDSCNCYRLIRDTGPLPPIPRDNLPQTFDPNNGETYAEDSKATARDMGWALMRLGQDFTSVDLVEVGMQRANALKYLAGLLESGHLKQISPAKFGPGGCPAIYRLVLDTGAAAPIIQRDGSVFDPNLPDLEGGTDGLD